MQVAAHLQPRRTTLIAFADDGQFDQAFIRLQVVVEHVVDGDEWHLMPVREILQAEETTAEPWNVSGQKEKPLAREDRPRGTDPLKTQCYADGCY